MANHIYVKPVPGRMPRHESTHQQLPEAGDYWQDTPYTRRRLRDGDIVEATDPSTLPVVVDSSAAAQTNDAADAVDVAENPATNNGTVSPTTTRRRRANQAE